MTGAGDAVGIPVPGWTGEQREDLDFLLADAGIEATWDGDRVVVGAGDAARVQSLVAYLSDDGIGADDAGRVESGAASEVSPPRTIRELAFSVWSSFEHHDKSARDRFPDAVFVAKDSLLVPGSPDEVFARVDVWGEHAITAPSEPGDWHPDVTIRTLEREAPRRLTLQIHDGAGEEWREIFAFEPTDEGTMVSLIMVVDRLAPDARSNSRRRLYNQTDANQYCGQRLGRLRDRFGPGPTG